MENLDFVVSKGTLRFQHSSDTSIVGTYHRILYDSIFNEIANKRDQFEIERLSIFNTH